MLARILPRIDSKRYLPNGRRPGPGCSHRPPRPFGAVSKSAAMPRRIGTWAGVSHS